MVHPECWVFCAMPHPPLHIWVHPHDWSLQLLYLSFLIQLSQVLQQIKQYIYNTFFNSVSSTAHEAHPQASGSEVVKLSLVYMHLYGIPTGNCHLQWWHMVHWQPKHTQGCMPWGVRQGVGGLITQG